MAYSNDVHVNNTFSESYHVVRTVYNNLPHVTAVNSNSSNINILSSNLPNITTVSNALPAINLIHDNLDVIEDTASIINELNGRYVLNITTLRALEPVYNNQIIYLLGHTTIGIGGGLFWYDVSDTTTTDNNGTVIVTVGGKRWKRVLKNDTVQPEMFGATGDGTTDDSVAFQKAVDTLKPVLLSQKTYVVGDILIPSSAVIDGQGSGRIYSGTINAKSLLKRKIGCFTVLDLTNSRGFVLKNFGVDGVNRNCHGIVATTDNCNQSVIENVSVQQCIIGIGGITQTGYYATMNSTHLNNVIVTRNTWGIRNLIDCHLVNPVIADNYGDGVYLATGHNANHFTNPRIEWNRGFNINFYEAADNVFVGGIVDRSYKAGILFQNAVNISFNGTIIKRNARNNNNTEGERSNIVFKGTTRNIIINGNIYNSGRDDGGSGTTTPMYNIEWASGHTCSDIIITSNEFNTPVTSQTLGTAPNESCIIKDNIGISDYVVGQQINIFNGRVFQSRLTASISNGSSVTLNMKNGGIATFTNAIRRLNIWARSSATGSDFFASFDALLVRENGSASMVVSSPVSQIGTAGSITIAGSGTILNLVLNNFSTDGSTFDIVVTNNNASTVNMAVELC